MMAHMTAPQTLGMFPFGSHPKERGAMATRIRIRKVMDGPGPPETIVAIETKGGLDEEVILPKDLVKNETIEVGSVGQQENSVLIELPHESASGNWRLWVNSTNIVP
jgi:hypothetical protein